MFEMTDEVLAVWGSDVVPIQIDKAMRTNTERTRGELPC